MSVKKSDSGNFGQEHKAIARLGMGAADRHRLAARQTDQVASNGSLKFHP
jgi:hypothetical protein